MGITFILLDLQLYSFQCLHCKPSDFQSVGFILRRIRIDRRINNTNEGSLCFSRRKYECRATEYSILTGVWVQG